MIQAVPFPHRSRTRDGLSVLTLTLIISLFVASVMVARTDAQTNKIPFIDWGAGIYLRSQPNGPKTIPFYPRLDTRSFGEIIRHSAYVSPAPRFALNPTATTVTPATPRVVRPNHRTSGLLAVVDQEDIQPQQRILADQVLRALPSGCRDNLKQFFVTYDKNPKNRGLGGESTIIVTGNVPDNEFMALIVHECGHVTDLGGLRGSRDDGPTTFADGNTPIFANDPSVEFYSLSWKDALTTRKGSVARSFVSGYAQSDPFEDFAETFAFFALHQNEFKVIAKRSRTLQAKYDFMDRRVFAGAQEIAEGQSIKKSSKSIPWDVTKLPYVWHAAR